MTCWGGGCPHIEFEKDCIILVDDTGAVEIEREDDKTKIKIPRTLFYRMINKKDQAEEIKATLGIKEYIKLQLKIASELIHKARYTYNEKEIVTYLLALSYIVEDCLNSIDI